MKASWHYWPVGRIGHPVHRVAAAVVQGGGGGIRMAGQTLDEKRIDARGPQVGDAGAPQVVGRAPCDAGLAAMPLQRIGQYLTARRDRRVEYRLALLPQLRQPVAHDDERRQRHAPFLAALADHAHCVAVEIDGRNRQGGDLAAAQARTGHQRERRLVARADRAGIAAAGVEEIGQFAAFEHAARRHPVPAHGLDVPEVHIGFGIHLAQLPAGAEHAPQSGQQGVDDPERVPIL